MHNYFNKEENIVNLIVENILNKLKKRELKNYLQVVIDFFKMYSVLDEGKIQTINEKNIKRKINNFFKKYWYDNEFNTLYNNIIPRCDEFIKMVGIDDNYESIDYELIDYYKMKIWDKNFKDDTETIFDCKEFFSDKELILDVGLTCLINEEFYRIFGQIIEKNIDAKYKETLNFINELYTKYFNGDSKTKRIISMAVKYISDGNYDGYYLLLDYNIFDKIEIKNMFDWWRFEDFIDKLFFSAKFIKQLKNDMKYNDTVRKCFMKKWNEYIKSWKNILDYIV